MNRIHILLALAFAAGSHESNACMPMSQARYAETEQRVKERFSSVDTVELATLQRADIVKVKEGGIDFEMDAERAVFRVDRVYKGKSKPGDTVVFTSVGSCTLSVVGNPKFHNAIDVNGKPVRPHKQWLIYRNARERTEITISDLTRPVDQA